MICVIIYIFLSRSTVGFQGLFFMILASLTYIKQDSEKPYNRYFN